MKKLRVYSLLIISMLATMLTACGKKEEVAEIEVQAEEVNMFGLTDDEQKMYAEYAAGVLMKYNAGSTNRVLKGQELINVEAKEQAQREQAAKREELAAQYQEKNQSGKKESNSSGGASSSKAESVNYIVDMAKAANMDAFSIQYAGCQVTDSYPSDGEDIFMAMDATAGKVLLVTEFKVTNITDQTENFNMFSNQGKFKLKMNGKTYKSQYTLLLDDLSMYKGDIDAGESIDTVLVFEIPESEAHSTNDMTLAITINDNTQYMALSGNVLNDVRVDTWEEETDSPETDSEEVSEDIDDNTSNVENDGDEMSDLAEEYLEALEALESGNGSEASDDTSNGNVTVVGSNRN